MPQKAEKNNGSAKKTQDIKKAPAHLEQVLFATGWNRTNDTRIFSPLLYQLSYSGISEYIISEPTRYVKGRNIFFSQDCADFRRLHCFRTVAMLLGHAICKKINPIVFFAACVECTAAVRARCYVHVVADGKRLLAHAAQNRLLGKFRYFPADNRVVFAFVVAFIARIELPAALEPNRHDVHGRMVVNAACLVINKFSEYSHLLFLTNNVHSE